MKKKFLPKLSMLVFVISMLSFICIADAGESDFVKLTLESSYQVVIPKSWKVNDEDSNSALQGKIDTNKNIQQPDGQNKILLAANGYAGNSTVATARLSVRYTKNFVAK